MKNKGYNMGDWTEMHNTPYKESYANKDSAYAGKQSGSTLEYVEQQDKMQQMAASKVESQDYHGRYE